jgi:hypothetical protein
MAGKPKTKRASTKGPDGERFCYVSDTHGDQIDRGAASIFREWMQDWKPTIRIHGGDAMDLRWLRSRASDQERVEAIQDDITSGCEFLRWYKPTVFLKGNHDDRLDRARESFVGSVRALAEDIQGDIDHAIGDKCRVLSYDKRLGVFKLGDVSFIHGFGGGIGSARRAGMVYGKVVQGHLHCVENIAIERHERGFAMVAGCLCKLDMSYASAHLTALRHAHGWVYGVVRRGGGVSLWQAHENGGAWILPSEMRQWHAPSSSKK